METKNISDILVLANEQEGKVSLLAAMTKESNEAGLKAGDLIKAIAPKVGGGGGGRQTWHKLAGKILLVFQMHLKLRKNGLRNNRAFTFDRKTKVQTLNET